MALVQLAAWFLSGCHFRAALRYLGPQHSGHTEPTPPARGPRHAFLISSWSKLQTQVCPDPPEHSAPRYDHSSGPLHVLGGARIQDSSPGFQVLILRMGI